MNGQLRRWYVGPEHDAANRREENEAQNDERDIFHPAKAMGTLFRAARGHNLKAPARPRGRLRPILRSSVVGSGF